MRFQTVAVVALALMCGGAAAVGINSLRPADPPPAPIPETITVTREAPKPETVSVVVAAVDIPPFTVIEAPMVKTRQFPKESVPAGALTKIADALERASAGSLAKEELVLNAKLAPKGSGRGMSGKVPPGMRAFTIHLPIVEAAVAGFVLPGNRVDVLITLEEKKELAPASLTGKGAEPTSLTATLLQDVEILAVEQRVVAPAESKVDPTQVQSVTLLVTPMQGQQLHLGQTKGKLHLALRNSTDHVTISSRPVYLSELLGARPRVKAPEPEKPVERPHIRTLRGTDFGRIEVQYATPDKGDR